MATNNKTAIQRIKSFNEGMSIMESITNGVASEQKAMLEGIENAPNGGVFDMGNLLDVDAGDDSFEPQLYNAPVEELDEADKRLIVSEFAKELEKISDEVIDFGKIGAVATVIQTKFGFKQNLEQFINDMITKSNDNQDSVALAHGKSADEVGEIADAQTGGEGSPTDIAPEKVEVGAPEAEIPMGIEMNLDVAPIDDIAPIEDIAPVDDFSVTEDIAPIDDIAPVDDVPAMDEIVEPISEEETEDNETAEEASEEAVEEGKEEESEEKEEEEKVDETLPVVNESIEAKLEAIKGKYVAQMESQKQGKLKMIAEALESKKLDAQLEAIKTKLKEKKAIKDTSKGKAVEVENAGMKKAAVKTDKVIDKLPKQKVVKAKLESIAQQYHAKEEAKVADSKLTAQLESIANGYKKTVTAQFEAAQAEKKIDATLNSLVESFQASKTTSQKQAIKDALKAVK